jgi:RNA polymerase sigma-70 factor (family 1)
MAVNLPSDSVLTDDVLLVQLQQGNVAAFDAIYHRYLNKLYLQAFKLLKNKDLSKDIVQEIFILLWEKREVAHIQNLQAYLLTATRYQIFKAIKKHRLYTDYADLTEAQLPVYQHVDGVMAVKEVAFLMSEGVQKLPQKCQAIFKLSRVDQLSHKEIARELSISTKTIENQLTIALKKLRLTFKGYF